MVVEEGMIEILGKTLDGLICHWEGNEVHIPGQNFMQVFGCWFETD